MLPSEILMVPHDAGENSTARQTPAWQLPANAVTAISHSRSSIAEALALAKMPAAVCVLQESTGKFPYLLCPRRQLTGPAGAGGTRRCKSERGTASPRSAHCWRKMHSTCNQPMHMHCRMTCWCSTQITTSQSHDTQQE
jgi:hypothetical protein